MIYEIRTYRLTPGSRSEVERRFAAAYARRRTYSPLAAFWHSEIGPLDEIVHVWPYVDFHERSRVRATAYADRHWPPRIHEFVVRMRSEILVPFPFVPELRAGNRGPIFEMRYARVRAGRMPMLLKRCEGVPAQARRSALVLAGVVEFGEVNTVLHVSAYRSLDRCMTARAAEERGRRRPWAVDPGLLVEQESKIVVPSAFSPIQ